MAVEWERDGKPCEVQFWDTAGQEALSGLRTVAYPDTNVFLLAYDMTRRDSLENIPRWLDEVQDECSDYDGIILIGTKYDLWCERIKKGGKVDDLVEFQEVIKIAEEIEAHDTIFTSARTGYGLPGVDGLRYNGDNADENEGDLKQMILELGGEAIQQDEGMLIQDAIEEADNLLSPKSLLKLQPTVATQVKMREQALEKQRERDAGGK